MMAMVPSSGLLVRSERFSRTRPRRKLRRKCVRSGRGENGTVNDPATPLGNCAVDRWRCADWRRDFCTIRNHRESG